jgi:hypothetical protein
MDTSNDTSGSSLDLDAYRWRNRLLLVFTPSPQHPTCRKQHSFLGQSGGLLQRDLLVATIYGQGQSVIGNSLIAPADVEALRARFAVAPDTFAAVLIGKDGGEKHRFDQPVAAQELFSLIDAMPMRQREMGGMADA